jgi:hypothetical protein
MHGVGIMNSTAFLLLANSNPEIDGNQEVELTIRRLNFRFRSLGSIRLSDPAKLDPLARETKTVAMPKSSVGSSSEVNSPVSFTTMENSEGKIEELDETMGNLNLGGTMDQTYLSQKDFTTRSGGISSNIHQLCVIITEAAEENNDADNAATHAQSTNQGATAKRRRRKSTSPPESGELLCQLSITVRRYPPTQEEKS